MEKERKKNKKSSFQSRLSLVHLQCFSLSEVGCMKMICSTERSQGKSFTWFLRNKLSVGSMYSYLQCMKFVPINRYFCVCYECVTNLQLNCWQQAAFPAQEKRLDALIHCTVETFMYLEENLKLTPNDMTDKAAASDELEEMHNLVCTLNGVIIICVLFSSSCLVKRVPFGTCTVIHVSY